MKAKNCDTTENKMAPEFQSIHQDGLRDHEEELKLLKKLDLGEYSLSNFKMTQEDPVIVVSYFVNAEETIKGKQLSEKQRQGSVCF
ncbi:MAG: hypothetical protein J7M18_04000 [Candidatus Eremiobacteraeota bacterium]|nr:hypothetical protein [Candidatus Eremiobacteraeota bacterium]